MPSFFLWMVTAFPSSTYGSPCWLLLSITTPTSPWFGKGRFDMKNLKREKKRTKKLSCSEGVSPLAVDCVAPTSAVSWCAQPIEERCLSAVVELNSCSWKPVPLHLLVCTCLYLLTCWFSN
ncbi:hypothetical protein IMY05_C3779001200 [Salix suchowensis]|nr:hypothetical protein IMY05_C3779001200 [Salix suchowensis]